MKEKVRTLVILRHAKSSWPVGVEDDLRPLSSRGRRDAPVAGRWIAANVGGVDLALVSPATRTQQTWQAASEALDVGSWRSEPRMYLGSSVELLELVRETKNAHETLVLVGHNPGCEELAARLASSGDKSALFSMRLKYPTAGVAVLACPRLWSQWGDGCAELIDFHIARG